MCGGRRRRNLSQEWSKLGTRIVLYCTVLYKKTVSLQKDKKIMNYYPNSTHSGPEMLSSEQIMDNFCLMMVEDFLKRKGMAATLNCFRADWNYSEVGCVLAFALVQLYYCALNTGKDGYVVV